ncbi:MAG: hypothetical protein NVSMB32_17710 [Actinomycetota bacterium]
MLTSPRADLGDPCEAPVVTARLVLRFGDPLRGSIDTPGHPPQEFCGWIDLMAAINTLRREPRFQNP